MTKTPIVILLLWCRFPKFYSNWVCFAHLNVRKFFLDCFQIELKIVFSIVFYTCGRVNCDNPNAIANLALPFAFSLSWTHNDCHISNEKAKSICNCISHVLRVMILSYLNNNINYHLCFSTLSAPRITSQNSNGIAIPFAFEFPMFTRKAVNQCEGAGLY